VVWGREGSCCYNLRPSQDLLRDLLNGPSWHQIHLPAWVWERQFSLLPHTSDWAYSKGIVTADMIREHLPAPGDDVLLLLCGPPPMVQLACHPNLDKLGYSQKMRFTY
jgi:hypothetical protein